MKKLMIALVLLMATPVWAEDVARRITVVGNGVVDTAPDMATISLGVVNGGKTGAQAMARNSEALATVLTLLTAFGIEERDIQTSNLSLSPRWSNRSSNTQPKVIGFEVRNTVTVRLRNMDQLGQVLDAVIQNGANTFHGLRFGLQDPQPTKDKARENAVTDAIRKARLYAAAAGVELGDVLTIHETTQGSAPGPVMMMEMDSLRSDVPVAAGEVAMKATITMVFEIGG